MKELIVGGKVVGRSFGVVLSKDTTKNISSPSVIFDGVLYHMWYSGCDKYGLWRIYYATSKDGKVWEKHGLVVDLGNDGESDSYHVNTPSVVFDGSIFHMWYGGSDDANWQIHYATSIDGRNWKKHGIIPSLMDEYSNSFSPSVIFDGETFRMWYINCTTNYRDVYYAISKDGVSWVKHDPVEGLCSGELRDCLDIDSPSVIYDGEVYHMFLTNDDGKTNSIYHATSTDGKKWNKNSSILPINENMGVSYKSIIMHNDVLKIWYNIHGITHNAIYYTELFSSVLKI